MDASSMSEILRSPWFVGVGIGLLVAAIVGIWKFFFYKKPESIPGLQQTSQNQSVVVNNNINGTQLSQVGNISTQNSTINVLFIDDDTRFKIVNILKKNSWIKCEIVKDVSDFALPSLVAADIIFVDIEGVGRVLTPQGQGLDMVVELHKRYPEKKFVIYSSQPVRDMTHPAFGLVEGVVHKEAQPSEFLKYIEDARR